jgi:hypothetical protein
VSKDIQHEDLVEKPSTAPLSANPFAHSANVLVSVPESVEVRLVDASVLSEYEVWSLCASILSSAVVGFLVAFFQAPRNEGGTFLIVALLFVLLFIVAVVTAFTRRKRLTAKSRSVRFRLGEQVEGQ